MAASFCINCNSEPGKRGAGEAKEKFDSRKCLTGGSDPQVYLSENMEEIRKETIRCIDEAAAGGGYILDNTDPIPEDAKV